MILILLSLMLQEMYLSHLFSKFSGIPSLLLLEMVKFYIFYTILILLINFIIELTNVASLVSQEDERYSCWYDRDSDCNVADDELSMIDHLLISNGTTKYFLFFYFLFYCFVSSIWVSFLFLFYFICTKIW